MRRDGSTHTMYNIQNSSTISEIRSSAGLSISEGFPQKLRDDVQAVINVNPKDYKYITRIATNQSSVSGNVTVATTSTVKDTYVHAISMTIAKNAACDIPTGGYRLGFGTDAGVQYIWIPVITLTASSDEKSISFPIPIKLVRGSTINIAGVTFAAGACSRSVEIFYTEVEPFEN